MCHVKRTSQAKLSIFVTFWDSFMTHVLTWRNRGTLLYYGFSHLKMTLVHCCILNSPLSDWILSRPRPWAQQLLVALQKWPPKVCKNGPTDAKLQKFIENSLQKPMVPGYLCPFPTSGAGRRDAVSKPYVKRETFYTAPLQREVTKIRHIWHDTWQFMVALDLHFQSTLASSEGAHWILEEMPDVFEWILVKFQNDWTWTQQKKWDCHMVFHGCHLWQFDQQTRIKDSMHLLQVGGRNTGSQRNSPWLKGVAQKSNYQLSTPHLDHVQSFKSKKTNWRGQQ